MTNLERALLFQSIDRETHLAHIEASSAAILIIGLKAERSSPTGANVWLKKAHRRRAFSGVISKCELLLRLKSALVIDCDEREG